MIQKGDTVQFKGGAIPEQIKWANTDYPENLVVGSQYKVESVQILSHCTRIQLAGSEGTFNSVHFTVV